MQYAGINGLSIIYVFTIVSFVSNINELLYLLYPEQPNDYCLNYKVFSEANRKTTIVHTISMFVGLFGVFSKIVHRFIVRHRCTYCLAKKTLLTDFTSIINEADVQDYSM